MKQARNSIAYGTPQPPGECFRRMRNHEFAVGRSLRCKGRSKTCKNSNSLTARTIPTGRTNKPSINNKNSGIISSFITNKTDVLNHIHLTIIVSQILDAFALHFLQANLTGFSSAWHIMYCHNEGCVPLPCLIQENLLEQVSCYQGRIAGQLIEPNRPDSVGEPPTEPPISCAQIA